ncbi:hypothetical protein GCM10010347_47650 [Streptomyces cirratus]|uniref:Chagasin family peptidase inhibitor I42 n=1 Tax=Streptomyces cirratus TaxID=68187 RepID=A0ABQ3EXQ7_9ACTN|nr:hypothetical protein [Streptomyces cirratus]GHB71771.1 hypothetical protein GCM10010347_47650 [Streptomyces cirratus]
MKTSKCAVVPLGLGVLLAAVTASVPAAAQSRPSSAGPAAMATRVTLTNVDDGRNVVLNPGDDVEVRLTGYRSGGLNYSWDVPVAAVPLVLRRTAGGTTPSGGASAVFHAAGPGISTITAVRHCRPDPGRACPLVIVPWKVAAEVK